MSGRTLCGLVLGALVVTGMLGCGGTGEDRVATHPVSGTVTLDGSPVDGATVTFTPKSGGRGATAVTDASGGYALGTYEASDGAPAGEYTVRIAKFAMDTANEETGEGDEGMEDENYDEEAGAGGSENELPEKYNNMTQSGLTATVSEGENTGVDFALESGA